MMNEVTSLQQELATLNETCAEDSDCSALSLATKPSAEEGSLDKPYRSPQKVDEVKSPQEEENEDGGKFVAKLIKNHESIIRQKNGELKWCKHGLSQDKKASSSKKRRERFQERIHVVAERLDNFTNRNTKLSESLFSQRAVRDNKSLPRRKLSDAHEIDTVSKHVGHWGSAWEKEKGVSDAGNEVGTAK